MITLHVKYDRFFFNYTPEVFRIAWAANSNNELTHSWMLSLISYAYFINSLCSGSKVDDDQHIIPLTDSLSQRVNLTMQSERGDNLEAHYAINFCVKLDKKRCKNMWNSEDDVRTILIHETGVSLRLAQEAPRRQKTNERRPKIRQGPQPIGLSW